jgi:hypothetical protein
VRIPVMAILAVFLIETTPGPQATPLPEREAFMSLVRSAIRLDSDLQKDFTYIERRRDVKVGAFGKVSVGPLRTFEVFPSADPTGTYKRLIAIDGKPLDPAELRRGDLEHQRDVENEAQKRRVETPAQQARRLEHVDLDRRQTQLILDDALRVFEAAIVTRETIDGEATIVVNMTPRANARVTTREGSWMKQFQGRAWFVEEDGQLARLDVRAIDDVSIGWGIVGRLHKGSRILVERRRTGSLWLPWRLTFDATGRTLLFRTFDVDVVTEYSDYKRKESGSAATVDCDCRL